MTKIANPAALLSLLAMEQAVLAGTITTEQALAALDARLARKDIADHKRKRTAEFRARTASGLKAGAAKSIFDALKAEGEAKKAQPKAAKAKAKPARAATPAKAEPAADPMSVIAASLSQLAQGQQAMMAFLAKFDTKARKRA